MSEQMTSIYLPGLSHGRGYTDWGRKTVPEMIDSLRKLAQNQLDTAEAILRAADSETYRRIHVQRDRIVLQQGKDERRNT
jgi:hypothetical protein